MPPERNAKGRFVDRNEWTWKKGKPQTGGAKKKSTEFKEWLKGAQPGAQDTIENLSILRGTNRDRRTTLEAAKFIIELKHGTPTQRKEITGNVVIRWAKELDGESHG